MKSIGILYICTGPYAIFWKDFYETFEAKFLPNTEKCYYVFTDADNIYQEEAMRVHKYYLGPQPWPLITLLRFHTFLSIRDELEKHDFLMFSNSNIVCENMVSEQEFLPDTRKGERMCFTQHPGYFDLPCYKVPYDRNPKSTAYIPYNQGKQYVIGAMFCGDSKEFLNMSEMLRNNINENLKNNIIARWHDESHINHYLASTAGCKILSRSYCYPPKVKPPVQRKLVVVEKQDKFDVKTFKGQNKSEDKRTIMKRLLDKIKRTYLKEKIYYLRDMVLKKSI